jgi:hypothetical protein
MRGRLAKCGLLWTCDRLLLLACVLRTFLTFPCASFSLQLRPPQQSIPSLLMLIAQAERERQTRLGHKMCVHRERERESPIARSCRAAQGYFCDAAQTGEKPTQQDELRHPRSPRIIKLGPSIPQRAAAPFLTFLWQGDAPPHAPTVSIRIPSANFVTLPNGSYTRTQTQAPSWRSLRGISRFIGRRHIINMERVGICLMWCY